MEKITLYNFLPNIDNIVNLNNIILYENDIYNNIDEYC
jgi:hypothetical protein